MNKANEGRIEIILGPMFSGKSTRLITIVRKYAYKNKKTIMIKFFEVQRYSENSESSNLLTKNDLLNSKKKIFKNITENKLKDKAFDNIKDKDNFEILYKNYLTKREEKKKYSAKVVTHDIMKYDSIDCKNLKDSFETLKSYDVIGIDEGQFFPDLVEICEQLASLKKIVIIAALNADFRMEPFPVISRIISKADKIELLKAYCFNCHKDAKFSLRIVKSNETVLIGGGEAYKPVCRECHKYFSTKRERGNLNFDEILKKEENKENNVVKEKNICEDSSFGDETLYSSTKDIA